VKTLSLSQSETLLVETIKEVQYGELRNVSIAADEPKNCKKQLQDGNAQLIHFIRENGYIDIPLITIHCGQARGLEIPGMRNGIEFTKKIRF
jgi:hypothetical protein